jgi:hypothetical protein
MSRIPRTTARRAEDVFRLSQTYLYLRFNKLDAEHKFTAAAKPIKEWLTSNGKEDADGNRVYRFGKTMQGADGKVYSGVMLKRNQAPAQFDPEEVLEFIKKVDIERGELGHLSGRVITTVEVPDLDELYVLQQEGKITEAQLRSLMHDPAPTFALWPVEATVAAEED